MEEQFVTDKNENRGGEGGWGILKGPVMDDQYFRGFTGGRRGHEQVFKDLNYVQQPCELDKNRAAWGPLALSRRPVDRHGERSGNTREKTTIQ